MYEVVHGYSTSSGGRTGEMVPLGAQDRAGTIADMTDMMIEPGEWNA